MKTANHRRRILALLLSLVLLAASVPAVMSVAKASVKASASITIDNVVPSKGKVAQQPDSIYYFKNGVLIPNYTGIVNIGNQQFYVKNGKVQTGFSGKVNFDGYTYTIKNGVVTRRARQQTTKTSGTAKKTTTKKR